MRYNGPAIKVGCVTWRSHPATGPGTLAGKLSRWQDRYGVLFAVSVQSLLGITSVAVQSFLREMGGYPGIVILLIVVARSGFVKHYCSVWSAEVKAKTMTSNLPLLSVL